MDTLRVFIRWLKSIDGVEQDLSEKVLSPSITLDENSQDVMLNSDRASKVLAHIWKSTSRRASTTSQSRFR